MVKKITKDEREYERVEKQLKKQDAKHHKLSVKSRAIRERLTKVKIKNMVGKYYKSESVSKVRFVYHHVLEQQKKDKRYFLCTSLVLGLKEIIVHRENIYYGSFFNYKEIDKKTFEKLKQKMIKKLEKIV